MPASYGAQLSGDVSERQIAALPRAQTATARLKVLLVTSFPPSRGDLNEYGYHLACSLQANPEVNLLILADETGGKEEPTGFHIRRCWRFDSPFNAVRLLLQIAKEKPDVVWFNIGFSTFARKPVEAFLALTVPSLGRICGCYTHITLHTIFERIDLKDAGVRWPALYRVAGRFATHLVLLANDVSVLLPSFKKDLVAKYGRRATRVQFRPHGTFESIDRGMKGYDARGKTILAFGYWGTYKRLEVLLAAMEEVLSKIPDAELLVAGTNHPSTPAYLESLQKQWKGRGSVQFLGYVPESDLPPLFHRASVLVLPYTSAAGTSGVMHQACQYGLPIVATSIPEIQEIAEEEKVAVELYSPEDRHALSNHLIRLLSSDEARRCISEKNLLAAGMMPMSQVVGEYLQFFEKRISKPRVGKQ